MKFIIKLFPEITIKSKPVRKQQTRHLRDNVRKILLQCDERILVKGQWDKIEVEAPEVPGLGEMIADELQHIPGIANILRVTEVEFENFDDILNALLPMCRDELDGKTIVVRVKRAGKHDFTSTDLERYLGGGLLKLTGATGVDLKHADKTIRLEVRDEKAFFVEERYEGLGGYPMGSQDPVLSLISGGYDSTVSTFLTMKRGLRTHFVFFNLGGVAHEAGVKQVALYLWEKYGRSHRVKFVSVPFEDVVGEILRSVHHSQMGVVLKRLMMKAATRVAERIKAVALVTGEAVAQVSSQTLVNLNIIDDATNMLVLRPLVTMDKRDIIALSEQIGTDEFARNMPEYCGVISDRPTTRARIERILEQESHFNDEVLEAAINNCKIQNLDDVMASELHFGDVQIVGTPSRGDLVVDIRHPGELEKKPLTLVNNDVVALPFYELRDGFAGLPRAQRYLLYCEKGTMSQLHAGHLHAEGHPVFVFKPV